MHRWPKMTHVSLYVSLPTGRPWRFTLVHIQDDDISALVRDERHRTMSALVRVEYRLSGRGEPLVPCSCRSGARMTHCHRAYRIEDVRR